MNKSKCDKLPVVFPTFWFCLHHPSGWISSDSSFWRTAIPILFCWFSLKELPIEYTLSLSFYNVMDARWGLLCYKCKFFKCIYDTYSRRCIYYTFLVYVWWSAPDSSLIFDRLTLNNDSNFDHVQGLAD